MLNMFKAGISCVALLQNTKPQETKDYRKIFGYDPYIISTLFPWVDT